MYINASKETGTKYDEISLNYLLEMFKQIN